MPEDKVPMLCTSLLVNRAAIELKAGGADQAIADASRAGQAPAGASVNQDSIRPHNLR